jgi:hypothetical protein
MRRGVDRSGQFRYLGRSGDTKPRAPVAESLLGDAVLAIEHEIARNSESGHSHVRRFK